MPATNTQPPSVSIAIVIGVAEYGDPMSSLAGCRDDALAVADIIRTDSKFVEPLVLTGKVTAPRAKQRIVDYLNQFKSTQVDDAVFYFSGHGDYGVDDFYYLFSDYDPQRKRQTALENSELDDLLRGVAPHLAVKIVDACHSGVSYVKSTEPIRKQVIEKSQATFQDCYFLFSSLRSQSSFQELGRLSDFTEALISAVHGHPASNIRYKDLIDYLRDTFELNQEQTPYFVIQGDMSHNFVTIKDDLRAKLAIYLGAAAPAGEGSVPAANKATQLVDIVKLDAARYATKDEALSFLADAKQDLEGHQPPRDLAELYEVSISIDTENDIPAGVEIGNWIARNGKSYFAETRYGTESYTVRVPDLPDNHPLRSLYESGVGGLGLSTVRLRDERRTRKVVVGFTSSVDLPYSHVQIVATPRYLNLDPAECWLVPIVNRTHAAFFVTVVSFKWTGWDSQAVAGKSETVVVEQALKPGVTAKGLVASLLAPFYDQLYERVKARFTASADARTPNES